MSTAAASVDVVRCKGCDKQIPADVDPCGLCGEPNPQAARARATKKLREDERCAFEMRGVRCPLPGSSSASRGGLVPRFCAHHPPGTPRDDATFRQLTEIQADPGAWLPPPRVTDADIEVGIRPEWGRQAGESRSAYLARMRAMHAALLPQVTRRQRMPRDGDEAAALARVDESLRQRGITVPGATNAPAAGGTEGAGSAGSAVACSSAALRPDELQTAPSPRPAPFSGQALEDAIEDARDQWREITARFEDEGMGTEIAMDLAFETVLRDRLGRAR